MSESQFYTFLTGGLGLLITAALMIAWQLWRMRDDERDGVESAVNGVAHEMRINLQRMVNELSQIAANPAAGVDALLPIRHPQLDGVAGSTIRANRNGLAVLGSTYQELEARKMNLRATLAQGREHGPALDDAMDTAINGIAALYMWEVHGGARPADAGKVRSWDVRDWMKSHGFRGDVFPGMHLRDEVVERLLQYGLYLTPKPLTHTAHEYYSMQYDRYADVRGPLGRRREKPAETEDEPQEDGVAAMAASGVADDEIVDAAPGDTHTEIENLADMIGSDDTAEQAAEKPNEAEPRRGFVNMFRSNGVSGE